MAYAKEVKNAYQTGHVAVVVDNICNEAICFLYNSVKCNRVNPSNINVCHATIIIVILRAVRQASSQTGKQAKRSR